MNLLTRREALQRMTVAGAALILAPPRLLAATATSHSLIDLADRIRATRRDRVFELAGEVVRSGAGPETLLGAVFLAGVHDIRPRHVGGKLHAVMMVESAFQLAEAGDATDAWLAALWNLDDFKRSQLRDEEEGDWELPPRPDVAVHDAAAARREFTAAMDAWDDDRADRALVALLPHVDRDACFEILWPYAARSFVDIGHKIIYAAQVHRTLGRIGWDHAEPALRSLVHGLLHAHDTPVTEAFDTARDRAPRLPAAWDGGTEAPARSADLLPGLRTADAAGAQDLVVAAALDGLGPKTIGDGLRLYGSELFLRRRGSTYRSGLLPVHAVTVTEAYGHALRSARTDAVRRLLLLQAAGWLPLLRHGLETRNRLVDDLREIDRLGEDVDSAPEDLLADPNPASARAGLDRHPDRADGFVRRLHRGLLVRGQEHHQHKYAAAVAEEAHRIHPRWRAPILAAAVPYLDGRTDPHEPVCARALRVIQDAGIR